MRQAPCDSFLTRRREDAKRNHVNVHRVFPFAASREPVSEGDDQRRLRNFCGSVVGLSCGRTASVRCTTNPSNLLPARGFLRISAISGHALVATAYAAAFFVHRCPPRPSRGLSCPTRLRASSRPPLPRLPASNRISNT